MLAAAKVNFIHAIHYTCTAVTLHGRVNWNLNKRIVVSSWRHQPRWGHCQNEANTACTHTCLVVFQTFKTIFRQRIFETWFRARCCCARRFCANGLTHSGELNWIDTTKDASTESIWTFESTIIPLANSTGVGKQPESHEMIQIFEAKWSRRNDAQSRNRNYYK